MNNLNVLRDRVFEINKANGWHKEKRTFGELIALVHSEVSEALEDYRNGKEVNEVWYEYKTGMGHVLTTEEKERMMNTDDGSSKLQLGKPCGIPSELADVVIRILDICGLYEWDIESRHFIKIKLWSMKFASHLASIHKSLSNAYNDSKDTFTDHAVTYLDVAIQEVEFICKQHNINLEQIIEEKLAYNATRGYKHGGKVI